jgi:AcrR family transcriptional regulator
MKKPVITRDKGSTEKSVRDAILEAAESLFAKHGFDGVSMRQLTQAAGTNLASVNYHFRSKENLFLEVISQHMRPVNGRRLEMLQAALTAAGDGPPSMELLLEAFTRPFFEACGDPREGEHLRRIVVRVFMEADSVVVPIFEKEMMPVAQQFARAIARARPELSMRHIALGLLFFAGAMINLFASHHRLVALLPIIGEIPDSDELTRTLVRCGVAAFDAIGKT